MKGKKLKHIQLSTVFWKSSQFLSWIRPQLYTVILTGAHINYCNGQEKFSVVLMCGFWSSYSWILNPLLDRAKRSIYLALSKALNILNILVESYVVGGSRRENCKKDRRIHKDWESGKAGKGMQCMVAVID